MEFRYRNSTNRCKRFIIELRSGFSLIEDYELVQIIEDYGIDFYPDKIN
ncbi:hypothetical protein J4462_00465 [Candidatus Pacearchaeota archaeon]|nr:hypothetical protein [Candidatus Pacearchaeota archaeon]